MTPSLDPRDPRVKWTSDAVARRYAGERWSSAARRGRDPRRVQRILAEFLPRGTALLLDAPCGAGRLVPALAARGRTVALDVSPAMLSALRASPTRPDLVLAGDIAHLPFRDDAFDAVLCCRYLHHLREPAALARALSELVRVSRGLVVASFWDSASLPEWRRALPGARVPRRCARPRAELARACAAAGAEVVAWRHSLRFVSRQAYLVARKRP